MVLKEKQKFVLFVLGKLTEEANKKLKGKLLETSISKPAFIEVVKKAGLTEKGERALYKNLEDLEKSRHISYENKILKLTNKGAGNYKKTKSQLSPYLNIIKIIESENLLKLTKKARTTCVSG